MRKLINVKAASNLLVVLKGPDSIKNCARGAYDESKMKSLVNPPKRIPWYLKIFIKTADNKTKKEMLIGRILAWSPKISISSGLLELYVEKGAALCLGTRLIKLLRMIISYTIPSQFVLDINSSAYKKFNITEEELEGLRGRREINSINSFTEKEKAALNYACSLSKTPIILMQRNLDDIRRLFSEKEIVAIAALTAKVNYWARLFEALRIKPAGFTNDPILHLEDYNTLGNAHVKTQRSKKNYT